MRAGNAKSNALNQTNNLTSNYSLKIHISACLAGGKLRENPAWNPCITFCSPSHCPKICKLHINKEEWGTMALNLVFTSCFLSITSLSGRFLVSAEISELFVGTQPHFSVRLYPYFAHKRRKSSSTFTKFRVCFSFVFRVTKCWRGTEKRRIYKNVTVIIVMLWENRRYDGVIL